MSETHTVHFKFDPALRAYLEWLDAEGMAFSLPGFDVFAAGYRARVAEDDAAQPAASGQGAGEGQV